LPLRRCLFFLCVIAALAGTPLRQAEAAHDFVCALDELDRDVTITEPDGRVGYDSGATIKAEVTLASVVLATADSRPATGNLAHRIVNHLAIGPAEFTSLPCPCALSQNAFLQCFLF
jgi:hypothetical protein